MTLGTSWPAWGGRGPGTATVARRGRWAEPATGAAAGGARSRAGLPVAPLMLPGAGLRSGRGAPLAV